MHGRLFEHPGEITGVVGRQAQFGAVGHNFGEPVERRWGNQPALVMSGLGPRVRKKNEDPADRARRQRRQQRARVIGVDANIGQLPARDLAEQLDDAVFEYLATNKADFRMTLGLCSQVLSAAKTNLEPDVPRRLREQTGRDELSALRQFE